MPGQGSSTPHLLAGVRALGLTAWPNPFAYVQGTTAAAISFSNMPQPAAHYYRPADPVRPYSAYTFQCHLRRNRATETAPTALSTHDNARRFMPCDPQAKFAAHPGLLCVWDNALIKFARAAGLSLKELTDTDLSFPLVKQALQQFGTTNDWISGRRLYLGAFVRLNYRDDGMHSCRSSTCGPSNYKSLAFGDPNGPTVFDGMLARPPCTTIGFQALPQRRRGIVELILFHAPSNALERFGLFNYLPTPDMAHLVSVSSSVHDGLMNTVTMFAFESHTASDLLACHLKVVSLLRRRALSLESLLWHYVEECGATPFRDWLEYMTQNASRDNISREEGTACTVDQYGVETGSPAEDDSWLSSSSESSAS